MPLFPYKLHELMTEMQSNTHLSSIISWVPSGNAFKIHEPELFQDILLKKYFPRQTKINSFKRQLLYYGFDNLGDNIFAHPCFLKDRRSLCGQINHSNPTKSQREAKAAVPSRRIRGKRAKQALRHRLIEVSSSQADNMVNEKTIRSSPITSPAITSFARPAAPQPRLPTNFSLLPPPAISNTGNTSALTQTLLQNRAMPLEYWRRMNSVPATSTTFGVDMAEFPKDQGLSSLGDLDMLQMSRMSGQTRMTLATMLQQRAGASSGAGGFFHHAVSA